MFLHMTKKIVFSNSKLLVLNFYKHYLHFFTLRSNVRACFFINTFSELNNTQSTVVFVPQGKSMKKKFNLRLFNLKLSIKNALTLFNNFYWFDIFHFLPFSIALKVLKKNIQKRRLFTFYKKTDSIQLSTNNFFYRNFFICSILFKKLERTQSFFLRCSHFYNKFILKYLEFYFNSRVSISFLPYCFYKKKCQRAKRALSVCLFPVLKNFNRLFFFNDFISVLAITFLQRNVFIFARWLIRFMKKTRIRLHKRFLFLLRLYFTRLFKLYSRSLKYKGFKLQIKGKISVAGSSKKRIFKMSQGLCSLTTKSCRVSYYNNIIRTYTGALGLKVFLFY